MLYSGKTAPAEKYDPVVNNNLGPVTRSVGHIVLYVFISIITLSLFGWIYYIVWTNKMQTEQVQINETASNIDIQLQKRFDTLTKMMDIAKQHCEFDKETLENITALRSGITNHTMPMTEANNMMNRVYTGFNALQENYPILQADRSIQRLMNESIFIEKELAASRRLYNSRVTIFNQKIYNFPLNVVLAPKGYHGIPIFAADEEVKKDVQIKFWN